MADTLTDNEIALLCDIGEYDPGKASAAEKRALGRLLSEGYVEPAPTRPGGYKPTAKGVAALGERGAGLNEA